MASSDRPTVFIHTNHKQILGALEAEFGRAALATPPKEGFDLVAWLVPIILVVAGLAADRAGPLP